MIEYFNFLLDELIFRYDTCQCRDENWKTYDKEKHVKEIRAEATALFDRYSKDSLGTFRLNAQLKYVYFVDLQNLELPTIISSKAKIYFIKKSFKQKIPIF